MAKLTFQSNRTGSYGLQIPSPVMGFLITATDFQLPHEAMSFFNS